MDTFGEQLVKKKTTGSDIAKMACLIIGGLVLASACMMFSFLTGFMVLTMISVGIIFGMVWILTGMGCEYEYIVTNEDLDIDKISGKRKRKRLITLKLGQASAFGVYDGSQGEGVQATVIASDGTGINAYYLIAQHKTHGTTMLIFSPDERTIGMVMSSLPHKVRAAAKLHIKLDTADAIDNGAAE